MSDGPQSWPHLVGKSGEEAVNIIKAETGKIDTSYLYLEIPNFYLNQVSQML